eukprot:5259745-Lingulodinium_polyedra.AAC.1
MGARRAVAAASHALTMPPGGGSVQLAAASPGPCSRTGCEGAAAAAPLGLPVGRPAAIPSAAAQPRAFSHRPN